MSLCFNMLFRFVIAFLTRTKHLLISWPQSPSAVILEPRKIKCVQQCRLKILLHHVPAKSSEARPLALCASASSSVKWDNDSSVSID